MTKEERRPFFRLTTVITIAVLLVIATMLSLTAWFVWQTIFNPSKNGQSETIDVKVDSLNAALLAKVGQALKDKQDQPLPDEAALRDPFVIQTVPAPSVPAPIVPVPPSATPSTDGTQPATNPVQPPPPVSPPAPSS